MQKGAGSGATFLIGEERRAVRHGIDQLLRVPRVGHVERNEVAPRRRYERYGRPGEKAVGEQDAVAIGRFDRGVAQADMLDKAGGVAHPDVITDADVALEFECDAAGDVAEHVLQGESDDGGDNGRGREYSSDVDAETVEELDADYDVADHYDHLGGESRDAGSLHGEIEDDAGDDLDGGQFDQRQRHVPRDVEVYGPVRRHRGPGPEDEPEDEKSDGCAEAGLAARDRSPESRCADSQGQRDPGQEFVHE